MINYIYGVVSLTEHYKEGEKHILIFGDYHQGKLDHQTNPCDEKSIHIIDFIINYIHWNHDMNGLVTDIFLEMEKFDLPFREAFNGTRSNYMVDLGYFFEKYIKQDEFKLSDDVNDISDKSRFHCASKKFDNYKRYRGNPLSMSMLITNLPLFHNVYDNIDKMSADEILGTIDGILEFCDDVYEFFSEEKYNGFMRETGIIDELKKSRNYIGKLLYTELHKKTMVIFHRSIPTFKRVETNLIKAKDDFIMDNITTNLEKEFSTSLNLFIDELDDLYWSHWSKIYTDVYLLAKLFNNDNYNSVIIYVGEQHARYYRDFLEKINYTCIRKVYNQDQDDFVSQCLDVSDFKFSIDYKPYCNSNEDEDVIYFYSFILQDRICMPRSKFLKLVAENGIVQLYSDMFITEELFNNLKLDKSNFFYLTEPSDGVYFSYIPFNTFQTGDATTEIYNNTPSRSSSGSPVRESD